MQKNSKLSVDIILPTFNSELLIKNTIEHILENSYDNYKMIISDDCSTDSTLSILEKLKDEHPEKIVLRRNVSNLGVLGNVRECLALSTADIVMYAAHDDLFYKDKIDKCAATFANNPEVALVYHDCDVMVNGKKLMRYSDTHKPREGQAWNYLIYGCFSTAVSVSVRGEVARAVGFRSEAGPVSDFLHFYESAKFGDIKYIPEVLGAYVRHSNNLSSSLRKSEDFNSVKGSLYILQEYPEDRFYSVINLQWSLIRIFYNNKKMLIWYLFSPLLAALWLIWIKMGKKRID